MENGALLFSSYDSGQFTDLLFMEVMGAHAQIAVLRQRIEELKAELADCRNTNAQILAGQFAPSSERIKAAYGSSDDKQMEFPETEAMGSADSSEESDSEAEEEAPQQEPCRKRRRSRKKSRKRSLSEAVNALPVKETITQEANPPECDICGAEMSVLGYTESREIVAKPAELYVRVLRTPVYVCRKCEQENTVVPIVHEEPDWKRPLPGSLASAEALASLIYDKCILGLPFYRMERFFADAGVPLSRTTQSNWMIAAAKKWLAPLAGRIEQELLKAPIICHDETPFHVLREPGRKAQSKGFAWIMASPYEYMTVRYVRLYYDPSRAAKVPQRHLAQYTGWLVTDGYSGYRRLEKDVSGIALSGCWAHARREWYKALKTADPKPEDPIAVGFAYVQKLFRLESLFASCTPEKRFRCRQRWTKPLLENFHAWLETQYQGQTALGKAVKYTLNQWPELTAFLEDGRLPITNAAAEIVAKHFAVCRKNCLFAASTQGAEALMDAMSVVLTAKANGLKPWEYLTWIFREMPVCMHNLEDVVRDAMVDALSVLAQEEADAAAPQLKQAVRTPDSSAFPRTEAEKLVCGAFQREVLGPLESEVIQMAIDECRQNFLTRFLPDAAPESCRSGDQHNHSMVPDLSSYL